jgi:hypothetical protein
MQQPNSKTLLSANSLSASLRNNQDRREERRSFLYLTSAKYCGWFRTPVRITSIYMPIDSRVLRLIIAAPELEALRTESIKDIGEKLFLVGAENSLCRNSRDS